MSGQQFEPGQTVRWYNQDKGWRFGRFIRTNGIEAVVQQGKKEVTIPITELEFYDGVDPSKK